MGFQVILGFIVETYLINFKGGGMIFNQPPPPLVKSPANVLYIEQIVRCVVLQFLYIVLA